MAVRVLQAVTSAPRPTLPPISTSTFTAAVQQLLVQAATSAPPPAAGAAPAPAFTLSVQGLKASAALVSAMLLGAGM